MPQIALIDVTNDSESHQLQEQIQDAEEEVAQLTLQVAETKLEVRRFQAEYSARIGPLYAELDEVEIEIREYQLRTELIRSGAAPDSEEIQERVADAFEAERERLHAYQEQVREAERKQAEETPDSRPLRGIYLRLAKRYHPDKAYTPEDRERNARIMTLINQAYEDGDRATLERLESQGDTPVPEEESTEARRRRLRDQFSRLKRSINELKQEIEKHRQSDIYLLKQQVESAREREEDLLSKLARDIQYKIAAARRRLEVVQNLFERWSGFLKGRTDRA